jgi:hypothetical protein
MAMISNCVNVPNFGQFCYPSGSQFIIPLPAGGSNIGNTQVFVPLSNGGVFGGVAQAFYPCQSLLDGSTWYYTFDPTQGFNDPNSPSQYFWRTEQMKAYRNPTIHNLLVTYRDLGPVTVTFTIAGGDDNGNPISQSAPVTWGNNPSTKKLYTTQVNILFTGQNPQLSVLRQPGAGCLSIVSVVMSGECEDIEE